MFSSLWEDRFDGSCVNYRMETTIWTILIALSKLSTFFENSYTCELYWPFSKINPTNFTLLCRERSIQCDTWLLESAKYRIRCNRRLCVACCAQFTKPMKLFPSTQYLFQGWSFLPERMNYTLYERRYGKRHVPFDLSEKVWRFYGRWKKKCSKFGYSTGGARWSIGATINRHYCFIEPMHSLWFLKGRILSWSSGTESITIRGS